MSENPKYQLQLEIKNGLHFYHNSITWDHLSFKIKQALKQIKPYAFFCLNNEPLILFFHNPQDKKNIHQKCWNFNKAAVIFFIYSDKEPISEMNDALIIRSDAFEIFNGFDLDEKSKTLNPLENADITKFSYWHIASGETWRLYEAAFKNETKVDNRLLGNIKAVREALLKIIKVKEAPLITNRVLGRLIFTRYLIDRKVKIDFNGKDYLSNKDLTEIISNRENLYLLFQHLQKIFNGDLFPFVENPNNPQEVAINYEKQQLSQANLDTISLLFQGGEVISGQLSLFDVYDFSIIPVELISNIYEYFMGDEKQDANKAFYTPPFLVDYLINETVEPFLRKKNNWNCKVLDPACGSGIFLVETLRRIILKYRSLNPNAIENIVEYKKTLLELLEENIYGIDKDGEAIDVAIFSLYVTILDFIEPKDIKDFKFRSLIGKNFFVGNFFPYEKKEANKIIKIDLADNFKEINLHFIIGNPPWSRGKKGQKNWHNPYAKQKLNSRSKEFQRLLETFPDKKKNQIEILNNKEIAQGFVIRSEDFANKNTTCALLVTSKVLHNGQSDVFRNYWLNHTQLEKVVDFSAVSEHLFTKSKGAAKGTLGPCSFLIYNWKNYNTTNIIQHYSPKLSSLFKLFKILAIQSYDYKEVKQQQFINYDWAWKVFLYGNILDFEFVLFLKKNFQTINDFISDKNTYTRSQGIMLSGDKNSAEHLRGNILIDTNKDISRYRATYSKNTKWYIGKDKSKKVWDFKYAHREKKELYEQGFFDGNTLVIKGGLTSDYQAVAAFIDFKGIFKSSLTAIQSKDKHSTTLKSFVGLLNSTFFTYFLLQTGSSMCVERKETHDDEKFALPAIQNSKIADLVDEISAIKKEIYDLKESEKDVLLTVDKKNQILDLEKQTEAIEQEIEEVIAETYGFTKNEKALIDFSQTVSIPLFKGEEKPFEKVDERQLKKYSEVFEQHFLQIFNRPNKYFKVEVFQSEFMVGVRFSVVKEKPNEIFNYVKDETQEKIIDLLSTIAFEERTDKIFIQKDVKIVNQTSFCVIKPNEYKCWHEAVAYLDLHQFIPALLPQKKQISNAQ